MFYQVSNIKTGEILGKYKWRERAEEALRLLGPYSIFHEVKSTNYIQYCNHLPGCFCGYLQSK